MSLAISCYLHDLLTILTLILRETITGKFDDTSSEEHKLYAKICMKRLAINLENLVKEVPNVHVHRGKKTLPRNTLLHCLFRFWLF